MDDTAARFEAERAHLHAVAYRMLGSLAEAEDAVQEGWLRLQRADAGEVRNLQAWLTTVVARVCLDMLRARNTRREQPLDVWLPDPIVTADEDAGSPEQHAVLAESIGIALLVVLDTLSPAERLAFVLHDVFGVPFEEIASILDRSPDAAKKLASRARLRLRESDAVSTASRRRQREVVDAFLAASRDGDFEGLLAILHPDVVLRAEAGAGPLGPSQLVRGAGEVARQAHRYAGLARSARPVLVNGVPGLLAAPNGHPMALLSVVVRDDLIVRIDILADPSRLQRILGDRTG